ncbi:hypothetical protein BDD12DRAFT_127126 [Trichophaea hybrida]|nr:hypothetical protein BDD12DRAFT_127126 [Trichophaea hybrida]
MFGPDSQFKEAIDVRRAERGNDPAVIPLYDEPEALELILKTLHHHNDELPDTIPLEQLAEIAVICDKYELHHAFRFVAKMWSDYLWQPVQPLDGSEEWVLISWVFGYEDKFTAASKYLIMYGVRKDDSSKDDWRTMLSDATPEAVTNKIAEQRELHLNEAQKHIEKLKADRFGGHVRPLFCQFSSEECDALQLGHLVKTLSKLDIIREEFCYQGIHSIYSIFALTNQLSLSSPRGCDYPMASHRGCSWLPDLKDCMTELMSNVRGLKFADFSSRRKSMH